MRGYLAVPVVTFNLCLEQPSQLLRGEDLRHFGVSVRLLRRVEAAQAAPVIPVKPGA